MKYLKSFNESINNDDIEDNLVELEDIGYTYKLESGYCIIEDDRWDFNKHKINNSTPGTKVSIDNNSVLNSLDISLDDIKKRFDEIHSVLTRIQSRVGKIHIWEFSFNRIVFLVLSNDTLSVSEDETKFINFTRFIGKVINNRRYIGYTKEMLYPVSDYTVTSDEIKREIKIDFSCSDLKSKRSIDAIRNSRIVQIFGNDYVNIDIDIIKVEKKSITFKLNDWFRCDGHGNREQ